VNPLAFLCFSAAQCVAILHHDRYASALIGTGFLVLLLADIKRRAIAANAKEDT